MSAAKELSEIYDHLGDYERAVACLRDEEEFWRERRDLPRQAEASLLAGERQAHVGRIAPAIETFERLVELSHSAKLFSVESDALHDLSDLYQKTGRVKEAESLRARAEKLGEMVDLSPEEEPVGPEIIPAQWLDLPSAPLVAEYRDIEGTRRAVLVNRSKKGIVEVEIGCVQEQDGVARIVGGLVGMTISEGGAPPGYYYEPFQVLNGPANQWVDEKMVCEGKARMSVIRAVFEGNGSWAVDGTNWVSR